MLKRKTGLYKPIFFILTLYLFFFMLKNPILASESCESAIDLCLRKIIPSLFPFIVLSDIMINYGIFEKLGNSLGFLLTRLFGISPESASVFIMGALGGFPLGAKSAVSLYTSEKISKEEAERLLCFCNNTGPSFIIGIVGSVINNTRAALFIYISQIISAAVIGVFLSGKIVNKNSCRKESDKKDFNITYLPYSITNAVIPTLNICAFIVFFSVINASLTNIITTVGFSNTAKSIIYGILEVTNGVYSTGMLSNMTLSVLLTAFYIGWSGLSVHLQTLSVTQGTELKTSKYFVCKLVQGLLTSAVAVLLCKIFKIY